MNDPKLLNFYRQIKVSARKIFVGPKKLKDVSGMLNIDEFVEVPLIDAFSQYDIYVLNRVKKFGVNDNNIYILCCSMMSRLICSDLKEITIILHY